MHRHIYTPVLRIIAFCTATQLVSAAESVPVEPGLWRTVATVNMPLMPEPQQQTKEVCMTSTELSPELITQQAPQCSVNSSSISGGKLDWTMNCLTPEGSAEATGQLEVKDRKKMTGWTRMNLAAGDQQLEITTQWAGEHIGPCK